MDVREKLVELLANYFDIGDSYAYNLTRVKSAFACGTMGFNDFEEFDEETVEDIATHLIAHGVTVQEWISVKDRLPEMRDDGFADAFLVTDGSLAHIAYFVDGEWIFTDNGEMKEPMFYEVTHWQPLPQPPKGE